MTVSLAAELSCCVPLVLFFDFIFNSAYNLLDPHSDCRVCKIAHLGFLKVLKTPEVPTKDSLSLVILFRSQGYVQSCMFVCVNPPFVVRGGKIHPYSHSSRKKRFHGCFVTALSG